MDLFPLSETLAFFNQHPPAFAHQLTAHQGLVIGMAEDHHLDRQVLAAEHQTVVALLIEYHAGTRGCIWLYIWLSFVCNVRNLSFVEENFR